MKIALIQQHAARNLEDNLRRGESACRKAAEEGAKLVTYAELGFTPFWPQRRAGENYKDLAEPIPGPTTEVFQALAKEYGICIVPNLFELAGDRTYDASPVIDADGSILGTTRMVHIMDGLGFYEKGYYNPGDSENYVYETAVGKIGVAICYDRHFPEYMRHLGILGAEIVVIPQAGAMGEWPEGIYEGELQVASFQNGYFSALTNRVGKEEHLHFSGESFVADPLGKIIARAPQDKDNILYAECDLDLISQCAAKKYFMPDRRPDAYRTMKIYD
jgi:beta-ureidopropionase